MTQSYCKHVRPPIEKYGTLQWGSLDEIEACGHAHMQERLPEWRLEVGAAHRRRGTHESTGSLADLQVLAARLDSDKF